MNEWMKQAHGIIYYNSMRFDSQDLRDPPTLESRFDDFPMDGRVVGYDLKLDMIDLPSELLTSS